MKRVRVGVTIRNKALVNLIKAVEEPEAVLLAAGNEVKKTLQRHYRDKNRDEPNRLGGKRTNFWADIGRSIDGPKSDGGRVVVSITDPRIRQKVFGGKIEAKRVTYLTIPLRPEAYDFRATVFEEETGIRLFYSERKGSKFLAGIMDGRFTAFYLLRRSVIQEPWPESLPSDKEMAEAAARGAEEALILAIEAA